MHFLNSPNAPKYLAGAISTAIDFYFDEPRQFKKMIKNSMLFDSSWAPAVKEQNDMYEDITEGKDIGRLTINDLKEPEQRHSLKILRKDDIKNLEKTDVLVFLAHPDDEIFFLPVMKALEDGKSVQFVYSSQGEKGHRKAGAPNTKKELAKLREYELLDALNELGVKRSPVVLNIPDSELPTGKYSDEVSKDYEQILERVRPKEVWSFGPDGFTGNGDHKKTGEIAFYKVKEFNEKTDGSAKLYQPALTEDDAQRFKNYASYTTDAFDFVSPSKGSNKEKIDVSKYREKYHNSLKKHKSQWTPNEVKAISDFYQNGPVSYVSLDTFPKADFALNPWKERSEQFSRKYGSDFEPFNSGVSFKPDGLNYKVNLYLSDFNKNTSRLWVETSGLKDYDLAPDVLTSILDNAQRIKAIPKFRDIKFMDVVLYDPCDKSRKIKVSVPVEHAENLTCFAKELVKKPVDTVRFIRHIHKDFDIDYTYI